jgi:regulator of RNase E activity RraA
MKCDVNIFGMLVCHDDVVYADVHGAVVIPPGWCGRFRRRLNSYQGVRR